MEERWEGLRVETHPGPTVRTLFVEEKASPVMLTFLWETQVYYFIPLSALDGGRAVEGQGPGSQRECNLHFFLSLALVSSYFSRRNFPGSPSMTAAYPIALQYVRAPVRDWGLNKRSCKG